MNNSTVITYRGANATVADLTERRVDQLQQQQGTRLVQYRGQSAQIDLNAPHQKRTVTVNYRGASAQVEL